jgi:hypothetical protein
MIATHTRSTTSYTASIQTDSIGPCTVTHLLGGLRKKGQEKSLLCGSQKKKKLSLCGGMVLWLVHVLNHKSYIYIEREREASKWLIKILVIL